MTLSRFLLISFMFPAVSGRLRVASARLRVASSMLSRFRLMDGTIFSTAKVRVRQRTIPVTINKIATMPVDTSIIHPFGMDIVTAASRAKLWSLRGESLFTHHSVPVPRAGNHRPRKSPTSAPATLHPLLPGPCCTWVPIGWVPCGDFAPAACYPEPLPLWPTPWLIEFRKRLKRDKLGYITILAAVLFVLFAPLLVDEGHPRKWSCLYEVAADSSAECDRGRPQSRLPFYRAS